jgi:hypothetical protein
MLESKADAVERSTQKERLFKKFMEGRDGLENCNVFIHNELTLKRINKTPV